MKNHREGTLFENIIFAKYLNRNNYVSLEKKRFDFYY